jgi:putative ABC transport system substrate-binding protein
MNKQISAVLLATAMLSVFQLAEAQQAKKVPRIGYMSQQSLASESARVEGFRHGLRDLGYIEGKNIAVEYRWGEGNADRVPDLAAELVRLKVDIIVAAGNLAALAAKNATKTIPIVFPLSGDPLRGGLVASLARPGGNVTGLTSIAQELGGKRLELLKEVVSRLSRVAVLSNPTNPVHGPALDDVKVAALSLGLQLQLLEVKGADEFESAFSTIRRMRAQALLGQPDEMFNTRRALVAALAVKGRLPTMFYNRDWAEAGSLMSYGVDVPDMFRRAAIYVDKILKGTKPADLPVEQPTKFEFVINLKTAKQIGLTIPQSVLYRADKVIR